jgi:methylglutaconyl-CoA hydratase
MTRFIKSFPKNDVQFVILSRPEKGNSYHPEMISEITKAFLEINKQKFKAVVLSGEGKNFCTGADLDWMQSGKEDMSLIRDMYLTILSCPHPLIGNVFGKIRGGGIGMTASCDIVIANTGTDFALTEIKHNLIPGMITPMIIAKTSESVFNDWATSGRLITVSEAKAEGLVTYLENEKTLDDLLTGPISIHPFRKNLPEIKSDLNHYLKLSAEQRKKMIRASGIS